MRPLVSLLKSSTTAQIIINTTIMILWCLRRLKNVCDRNT